MVTCDAAALPGHDDEPDEQRDEQRRAERDDERAPQRDVVEVQH